MGIVDIDVHVQDPSQFKLFVNDPLGGSSSRELALELNRRLIYSRREVLYSDIQGLCALHCHPPLEVIETNACRVAYTFYPFQHQGACGIPLARLGLIILCAQVNLPTS